MQETNEVWYLIAINDNQVHTCVYYMQIILVPKKKMLRDANQCNVLTTIEVEVSRLFELSVMLFQKGRGEKGGNSQPRKE